MGTGKITASKIFKVLPLISPDCLDTIYGLVFPNFKQISYRFLCRVHTHIFTPSIQDNKYTYSTKSKIVFFKNQTTRPARLIIPLFIFNVYAGPNV